MVEPKVPDYYIEGVRTYRRRLTSPERALTLQHTVDPAFVNRRLVHTVPGNRGTAVTNDLIAKLPAVPDWQRTVQIDHIYKNVTLKFCELHRIRTLGELIHDSNGHMFCSTEPWAPCPQIYDDGADRLVSCWAPYSQAGTKVELHYSAGNVSSDTLWSELLRGAELSVIAHLYRRHGDTVIFHPMIVGNPWLDTSDPSWPDKIIWWGRNFYEHFVEDLDEFSRVKDIPEPNDPAPMAAVSERAFKLALSKILGDAVPVDWGGETSDFTTSHLHLSGRRSDRGVPAEGAGEVLPDDADPSRQEQRSDLPIDYGTSRSALCSAFTRCDAGRESHP